MEKEFDLSECRRNSNILFDNKPVVMYMEDDVKEFIKRLKVHIERERNPHSTNGIDEIKLLQEIDKLAGKDLIEGGKE